MFKPSFIVLALGATLALPALPAQADSWRVDIDTLSLAGMAGYLDLQFNPGGADAAPVQVSISHFSSDAVLGAGLADGAASGGLPDGLVLDNSAALNAWLQGLVFGSHIAFTLAIDGPPVAGSGSLFSTLLWDADFNALLPLAGEDAALRVDLMPGVAPAWLMASAVQVSAVPEPDSVGMMLAGLGLVGFMAGRRARANFNS